MLRTGPLSQNEKTPKDCAGAQPRNPCRRAIWCRSKASGLCPESTMPSGVWRGRGARWMQWASRSGALEVGMTAGWLACRAGSVGHGGVMRERAARIDARKGCMHARAAPNDAGLARNDDRGAVSRAHFWGIHARAALMHACCGVMHGPVAVMRAGWPGIGCGAARNGLSKVVACLAGGWGAVHSGAVVPAGTATTNPFLIGDTRYVAKPHFPGPG